MKNTDENVRNAIRAAKDTAATAQSWIKEAHLTAIPDDDAESTVAENALVETLRLILVAQSEIVARLNAMK